MLALANSALTLKVAGMLTTWQDDQAYRLNEVNPEADELRPFARSWLEQPALERARHAELLYSYRGSS